MGNACRSFGFDEDDGMRIFSIIEMFLACYHVLAASYIYKNIFETIYNNLNQKDNDERTIMVLGFLFMINLVLQGLAGFLLYLKGWKERNILVCYVWILIAIVNNLLCFVIGVIDLFSKSSVHYWVRFLLYLVYVFYGVWVVKSFVRWAKENEAVERGCGSCSKCIRRRNDVEAVDEVPGASKSASRSKNTTPSQGSMKAGKTGGKPAPSAGQSQSKTTNKSGGGSRR